MGMVCCVQHVRGNISQRDTEDNVVNDNGDDGVHNHSAESDYSRSLDDFPTELLIKILSYLPTRDMVMMRYVSRRFRDVSDVPLLWKEFVWRDYEPRHVRSVIAMLKEHGEHVRRIFFPAHLTPNKVLKMARCCTQVTHLSLPRNTQLTLDDLRKVVCTMACLHQLDVFAEGNFIQQEDDESPAVTMQHIRGLLKITVTSVKELKLHVTRFKWAVDESIKELVSQGYTLPTIIIFTDSRAFSVFSLWVKIHSKYEPSSFEIRVYDYKPIPMNLYPLIPLKKFKFGPSVTPPFIQLSSHGIVGLKEDIFHLSEYDYCGTVRHTLIPMHVLDMQNIPISSHLHSVTYLDVSKLHVCSNHLEQLAIVCPNLQRLNLQENINCLKDLQGLHAIVNTCENLEGLNLAGISVSQVESFQLLWELLSSLKKLTHLAIDLCLLKPNDANKQKLINMFKSCLNLRALEISRDYLKDCKQCTDTTDFLFSYFPSLAYCRMYCFRYSALTYAITNCHKLKYLYEKSARKESLLPLSNNCHLQQLCIYSLSLNLTDELVEVLSAHGDLERVILYVKSITIDGIVTLINNSPKLTLLHISMIKPLFNEGYIFRHDIPYTYTDTVKEMFPYRKLFAIGSFSVRVIAATVIQGMLNADLVDTDLNSLWVPPVFDFVY